MQGAIKYWCTSLGKLAALTFPSKFKFRQIHLTYHILSTVPAGKGPSPDLKGQLQHHTSISFPQARYPASADR